MAYTEDLAQDDFYLERKTKWDLELSHIYKNHPEYFKNKNLENSEELNQHMFFTYDTFRSSIGFRPDSDLPDQIREECLEAFHRVWAPA